MMSECSLNIDPVGCLYATIRDILLSARQKAYHAVNFSMVQSYWQIGKLITEEELGGRNRAGYGKQVMEDLSVRLTAEFGKGFDARELRKICQFYRCFPKWDALRPELSWSHYRRLIAVENPDARMWYMSEAADSLWSTRQLDRQISTLYYDRLLGSKEKEDVGQMDSYIRMFDDLYKNPDDNPTIGLILCSQKNEAIARYSVLNDAKQIFASKYMLTLPSLELLQQEIEKGRKAIEDNE